MLCLEIPGCVQHKLMYGVVLRKDLTHHNAEMIHSEKNHIRNITLHHSSIKAKKCTVLDTSRTSW